MNQKQFTHFVITLRCDPSSKMLWQQIKFKCRNSFQSVTDVLYIRDVNFSLGATYSPI